MTDEQRAARREQVKQEVIAILAERRALEAKEETNADSI